MPPTLWYQSDIDTTDMVSMFTTRQADWASVRNKISAMLFYEGHLTHIDPANPWALKLNTWEHLRDNGVFEQLTAWNIPIGVESAAVFDKPDTGIGITAMNEVLSNLASRGAHLSILNVDTPRGRSMGLGYTEDESVTVYKTFYDAMRAVTPALQIGEWEAIYTVGSSATLKTWFTKCRAAGIFVDWFTADVGFHLGQTIMDELLDFIAWAKVQSPPLPVTIGIQPGQTTPVEPDDGTYVIQAHDALTAVHNNIPGADIYALEVTSWYGRAVWYDDQIGDRSIPLNLPEGNAWYSHTWLAAEAAAFYGIPDAVRGLAGFSHVDGLSGDPVSSIYREAGGLDLEPAGAIYELVAAGAPAPPPTYPLLTRLGRASWRGSWRGPGRGSH